MSDDFIPLNQSTPVHNKGYQSGNWSHNQSGYNNRSHGRRHRGGYNNRWGNNSRNSSFGSESNTSYGQDRNKIDAYLHPSMLEDPWAKLRQKAEGNKT